MKIQAKIASVNDELDSWSPPDGGDTFYIAVGMFEDGSKFKAWAKDQEKANATRNTLAEIAGQSGEFEVDDKIKEYRGVKEYKLKAWPGKPEKKPWGGGGGGYPSGGPKKEYVPRYKDTMAGVIAEQDSIHRSVALTQAIIFSNAQTPGKPPHVLSLADAFYEWLSKDRPVAMPEPTQPAPLAPTGPPAPRETIGTFDPLKDQKDFFGGLTTGDKIKSQTVQKYLEELEKAVTAKDSDRVEKLAQMVSSSLEKKTISMSDIDQWLEPAIMDSRKALRSAEEFDQWYAKTLQGAQEKERTSEVPF